MKKPYSKPATSKSNSSPEFIAYAVREGKDEQSKDVWTRIGAVFAHGAGVNAGFTILLDALPINGKIVCMPPKEDDKQ